jgi:hypothetical protein
VSAVRRLAVALVVLTAAALIGMGAGLALGRFGAGDAADAAVRDRLDARAAAIARSLMIDDPPMVEPVRILAEADWAATEVDCIHHLGFEATATPDGRGISFTPADEEDVVAFRRAFYVCEVRYPTLADAADPGGTT